MIDIPVIEGLIDQEIEYQSDWSVEFPNDLSDFDDCAFDDPPAVSANHELDEIPLDVDQTLEKTYMLRAERVGQAYLNERDVYHHHTAKQRYEIENEAYVPKDSYWASAFGYDHEKKEPCGRINTTKPGADKFTYQIIPKNWTKIVKKKKSGQIIKKSARCFSTPPTQHPPPSKQTPPSRTNWHAVKRAMHKTPKNPKGRPKTYADKAERYAAQLKRMKVEYRQKHPKNETFQQVVLKKQGKKKNKLGHMKPIRYGKLPRGNTLSAEEVSVLKLKGAFYKKTGGYLSDPVNGTIMMGNDGQLYHSLGNKVSKLKVSKDLTVTWSGKKFMVKQFVDIVITEEQLAAKREKDNKRYKK